MLLVVDNVINTCNYWPPYVNWPLFFQWKCPESIFWRVRRGLEKFGLGTRLGGTLRTRLLLNTRMGDQHGGATPLTHFASLMSAVPSWSLKAIARLRHCGGGWEYIAAHLKQLAEKSSIELVIQEWLQGAWREAAMCVHSQLHSYCTLSWFSYV